MIFEVVKDVGFGSLVLLDGFVVGSFVFLILLVGNVFNFFSKVEFEEKVFYFIEY